MSDLSADEFQGEVVLPTHVFFYTVEQIGHMLDCSPEHLRYYILYYQGRDYGPKARGKLRAINIATPDDKPIWRISEQDFISWLKSKGITFHETVRPSRLDDKPARKRRK